MWNKDTRYAIQKNKHDGPAHKNDRVQYYIGQMKRGEVFNGHFRPNDRGRGLDSNTCLDQEEGIGSPDPLGKSQSFGFLSNTGPDPLENYKATPGASIQSWAIITQFKWCFTGGP